MEVKWSDITSHQKLAVIALPDNTELKSIDGIIKGMASPFKDAKANLTWTLTLTDAGFVLKIHAMREGK